MHVEYFLYEKIGLLLLAGLPEKFYPMIMALEHFGKEMTADAMKSKPIDIKNLNNISNGSAFVSRKW